MIRESVLVAQKAGKTMNHPKVYEHIPLESAYLCQDCDAIGNCSIQCPACASRVLLGLASVLNREIQETQDIHEPIYIYRPALVA
jgi:hypothetical protein